MILFYIKYSEGGILWKFRTNQNQKIADSIVLSLFMQKKKKETMQQPSRPLAAAEYCFHI